MPSKEVLLCQVYDIIQNQMHKITVSDLIAIKQIKSNSQEILKQSKATYVRIQDEFIIIYTNDEVLTLRDLGTQKVISSHQIKLPKIKLIVKLNNLFGIVCESVNQFMVLDFVEKVYRKFDIHLGQINDLISHGNSFVTCSKDLTIRLWEAIDSNTQILKNNQILVRYPVALKGHKGSIITLEIYDKFLMSGSQDKSITCWVNKEQWATHLFTEKVQKILSCFQSQQIIVITKNSIAHFISIKSVIKKKIQVTGTLNLVQISRPIIVNEIDQSFLLVVSPKSIKFIQVNLIKQIHEAKLQKQSRITNIKCKGRCLFYGQIGAGIKLIKI